MARLLKRWESPRREGRNDKGRGGSARQRQLKKQQQMLRRKLKEQSDNQNKNNTKGGNNSSLPYFFASLAVRSNLKKNIILYPVASVLFVGIEG